MSLRQPILRYPLIIIAVTCGRIDITTAADQDRFIPGQLLVATAEMKDPRFAQAVIYIVKHDVDGAFGLVVNRPIAKGPIEDLLKGLGVEIESAKGEVILHYGGPVNPGQGFVLHSDDVVFENSIKLANGLVMTANITVIEAMARDKGPKLSLS